MPYTQVFFPNPPPANRLTSSFGAFSSMNQVKVSTSSPAATLVPLLTRTLRCARRLGVITPQKMNNNYIERGSRIDGIDFYVDICWYYDILYIYISHQDYIEYQYYVYTCIIYIYAYVCAIVYFMDSRVGLIVSCTMRNMIWAKIPALPIISANFVIRNGLLEYVHNIFCWLQHLIITNETRGLVANSTHM